MPSKVSNLYSKDDPTMIVYPNVQAANIPSNAITADKVADGAITTAKVASGAITSGKLASQSVTSAKIDTGAVTTGKIADASITAAKIANGTITGAKIATNTIEGSNIKSNTITADCMYVAVTAFDDLGLTGLSNAQVWAYFALMVRSGLARFLFDDGEIVTPLFIYCDSAESPNWVKAYRFDDDGSIITYTLCDNNSDIDTFLASANAGYCKIIG